MKKSVLAVAVGMTFMGLQPVQAVEVKLSGQINRAVMWADNGNESEVFHVDNDNSSTRFRITGSQQVSDSIKTGKDESSNYGVAYVVKPWSGIEFYGTYRVYTLDREDVTNIDDIKQFMVGTRVKF